MYPLPAMDTMTLSYAFVGSGKIKVHKLNGKNRAHDRDQQKPALVPIFTAFGISARLRCVDQADAYGLRCLVQDMNSRPRPLDINRADLSKMGATESPGMLFAAGLRTEADGDMIAVQPEGRRSNPGNPRSPSTGMASSSRLPRPSFCRSKRCRARCSRSGRSGIGRRGAHGAGHF